MRCDKGLKYEGVPFDELWQMLTEVLYALPRALCVADALDEMTVGYEDFISKLVHLAEVQPATVKVCVTSRPVPRIKRLLKTALTRQLNLSPTLLRPSIAKYIENRLLNLQIPQSLCARLEEELMARSDGLYPYIKLVMDELLKPPLPDQGLLLNRIASLPAGLAYMYTRMLLEHSQRSKVPQRLQIAILRWVTHSARPLRILELASIIDSLTSNELLENIPELRAMYPNTKSIIKVACGHLVEILEDETVSIIHHSLTEYIVGSARNDSTVIEHSDGTFPTIDSASSHIEMAITCLQHLMSDWDNGLDIDSNASYWLDSPPTQQHIEHSFLGYAGKYWPHHVRKVHDGNMALFDLLDRVINPPSNHFQKWRYLIKRNYAKGTTALHFAASQGFASYIVYLLRSNPDANAVNDWRDAVAFSCKVWIFKRSAGLATPW